MIEPTFKKIGIEIIGDFYGSETAKPLFSGSNPDAASMENIRACKLNQHLAGPFDFLVTGYWVSQKEHTLPPFYPDASQFFTTPAWSPLTVTS